MIIRSDRYFVVSENSNRRYWGEELYPTWTAVNGMHCHPQQMRGTGVEPHYHDCDEIWLYASGHGEVWLDGRVCEITPNTFVYTPRGVVHRFQMFAEYENNSLLTCLEGSKRRKHILFEEDGPPEPTVAGFVVPGAINVGPFPDPGTRCPLSEMRLVVFGGSGGVEADRLAVNEHWALREGSLQLTVDGLDVELAAGDLAMLRAGAVRSLSSDTGARVVLARERTRSQ